MTRPPEPVWPTTAELFNGMLSHRETYCSTSAELAIAACRKAWLVSVDDPSTDLTGTVRTGPDGVVVVRSGMNDGEPWLNLTRANEFAEGHWLTDADVRGWTFTCNIPGTPAWDAAQAVSS